ncbi:MAG: TonB-dependent siderophore receptor [Deltaproteobacteria bacterium]|jgi:iron complex outermembrane receptor protein|nr:TonB-dependent siderophore receptor [Deltaproteobacteria bacterium]
MINFKVKATLAIFFTVVIFFNDIQLWAQSDGSSSTSTLPRVLVEDNKQDGSAEVGYVVKDAVNFGPWGDKPVLDLPYTVSVTNSHFFENIQARNPGDVLRKLPNMFGAPSTEANFINSVITRGFRSLQKNIMNGIQTDNVGLGIFIEDVDSMEVMSGLNGFMYGLGNVGGIAVYNLKKPTYEQLAKIRFGDYGGGQFFGHLDVGGPLADGKVAYRFNVLGQDGHTSIDRQTISKQFSSAAMDFNISENIQLQVHGAIGRIDNDGRQGAFTVRASENYVHKAPDPSKLWVSDDTFTDLDWASVDLNLNAKLNDVFSLRFGYAHRQSIRKSIITVSYFDAINTDAYNWETRALNWKDVSDGAMAYLDAKFDTMGIEHNLTVGFNGYRTTEYIGKWDGTKRTVYIFAQNLPGSFLVNSAVDYDLDRYQIFTPNGGYEGRAKDYTTYIYNFMIGDEIHFNDQWHLMAGLNYANVKDTSFTNSGQRNQTYQSQKLTPTLSLIFKPIPNVTTYASYIQSLENGTIVGATYANAGELLKPLTSDQYEIGVKAEVAGLLLSAAFFKIDKGLQFADVNNYYKQDGRQRNKGVELSVMGRLFDSLNLFGGITFLDAKMVKTQGGNLDGNRPQYIPNVIAKLYAEYDLPFLQGLTVSAGFDHFGSVMANATNLVHVPSYTTVDVGLRYKTSLWDHEAIFRLDVNNVGDKAYWAAEPGAEIFLAPPRNVILTGSFAF